nr:glycosyltransferase family 1 protein [Spirosoma utsteinense]
MPKKNFYKKAQFTYRSNQVYTVAQMHGKSFDVFHATYYDSYFIPHLRGRPFTVTFLDMIHEKFSNQFATLSDSNFVTKQKQLIADRADRIIAISESTKRDVVELLSIDPAKIDVIYLGNSLEPVAGDENDQQSHYPYLLFVGRRERYKNFEGMLHAIHPVLKKHKIKLVCAGGGPFSNNEKELIHKLNVDDLVVYRIIENDIALQKIYRQAIAFIFPTMYEGFGIPVLEAFASDCPCIVSNLSSLPEVAGDAALYIDPAQPDSMPEAIEQLLHDNGLRQKLIKAGQQQLSHFSWQRTVDETLSLYKRLA